MKISLKWLSEMVDISAVGGPEKVAELLTQRGIEVEEIHQQGKGFDKVVTAQILERGKHPEADRLSLCKVSVGSGEPLEIVCGAQNMKAGDKVALAQIGASLPNGLTITQSKIRGVVSNGMLCSEEELKLKDKSEGILILPPSTPLGKPLASVLGLDDTTIDFKPTANRGDLLSHYGLAREIASFLQQKPKKHEAKLLEFTKTPIAIELNAGELAPQFYGCYIEGVKIGPSPDWLVKRLEAVGSRAINNVVDATNLVMLELGHPTHAYDATRIQGGKIQVRKAKAGEELPLLDGTSVKTEGWELVIADAARAIGLAGVMGGGNSEVQDSTTSVFLECAEFDAKLVRRASSKHQKKTEAATRFEKGIDSEALPAVISRLARLVVELAGGTIRSAGFVGKPTRARPRIATEPEYFEEFLGIPRVGAEAERILAALGCEVRKSGKEILVTPPSYRLDLHNQEDLAEEVARMAGYDRIAETVPPLRTAPQSIFEAPQAAALGLMDLAKDALARAGLYETINFAFTSQAWLSKFGASMKSSAVLMNPLSEEYEALVPSLLPGLIKNALDNWNTHFGSEALPIRLFELRPTFHADGPIRAEGEMQTSVRELWRLALVMSGPRYAGGLKLEQGEVDFFDLKAAVEGLFSALGTRGVRVQPASASRSGGNPLFHPGQSAEVLAGKDVAGYFGLLHPGIAKQFKLRAPLWIAELDWTALAKLSRQVYESPAFKPWSQFPSIERDFALLVPAEITVDRITSVALKAGKPLARSARVFDIYRGAQVAQGMSSVAVRVVFGEDSRSLQEAEAEGASAQILAAWKKELGIELRA